MELEPNLLWRTTSGMFVLGFGLDASSALASLAAERERAGEEAGAGVETEERGGGCKTSASELSLSL